MIQASSISCRMLLNGDASQWDRALQMPHYNARAMPAISFHTGVHLIQWARTGRFTLYNYGSAAANRWESSAHNWHATDSKVEVLHLLLDFLLHCSHLDERFLSFLVHTQGTLRAGKPAGCGSGLWVAGLPGGHLRRARRRCHRQGERELMGSQTLHHLASSALMPDRVPNGTYCMFLLHGADLTEGRRVDRTFQNPKTGHAHGAIGGSAGQVCRPPRAVR